MSGSSTSIRTRLFIIASLIIGLFVILVAVSLILARTTQYNFATWIQIFGSAGSLIFSALVVYLYMKLTELNTKQAEIASQQANIQSNQNSIMQFQQRPVIVIQDYEVGPAKEIVEFEVNNSSFWQTATGIKLSLANQGQGLAENIELQFTGIIGTEGNFDSFEDNGIFVTGTGLSEGVVDEEISFMSGRTGNLPPNTEKTFTTTVAASFHPEPAGDLTASFQSIADGEPEPTPIRDAVTEIDDEVTILLLKIDVSYEYLGTFTGTETFLRVSADPKDIDVIKDFFELGRPISPQEATIMAEILE